MASMTTKIAQLFVGTEAAERNHLKRLEREQAQYGKNNKLVSRVTFEKCPPAPPSRFRFSKITDPLPLCRRPKPFIQLEPTPEPVPPVEENPKALIDIPPDASAIDMTDADVRRVCSSSALLDTVAWADNMPAMPEYEGHGRYRLARNVTDERRLECFRKHNASTTDFMLEQVRELDIPGVKPAVYDAFMDEKRRKEEAFKNPYDGTKQAEYIDTQNIDFRRGSLVTRGFSSSTLSNSCSSSALSRRRKSSSQSSAPAENSTRATSRQSSNGRIDLPTSLHKIDETVASAHFTRSKIEKPCEFNASGDPDNAVASDDDDDDEWSDAPSIPAIHASALSESLRHAQKRPAGSNTALNRPAVKDVVQNNPRPRQSSRPVYHRQHSRDHIRTDTKDIRTGTKDWYPQNKVLDDPVNDPSRVHNHFVPLNNVLDGPAWQPSEVLNHVRQVRFLDNPMAPHSRVHNRAGTEDREWYMQRVVENDPHPIKAQEHLQPYENKSFSTCAPNAKSWQSMKSKAASHMEQHMGRTVAASSGASNAAKANKQQPEDDWYDSDSDVPLELLVEPPPKPQPRTRGAKVVRFSTVAKAPDTRARGRARATTAVRDAESKADSTVVAAPEKLVGGRARSTTVIHRPIVPPVVEMTKDGAAAA
ncbi:uncharacterized protein AB675_5659 [Cyphellophora attinorum]|uniref:Uncharacterized protein n=1 Tax=Cyphellophora attinorum TaxID=1664694 RepID=A0A0N0NNS9_9EURO|nr:uncharacterized protein AB675_5659 [Phialophora attinorum]KPI41941.1 hypothetical protein AB675_5659 [Phialophora attinorum]